MCSTTSCSTNTPVRQPRLRRLRLLAYASIHTRPGNASLVYAIIRRAKLFYRLSRGGDSDMPSAAATPTRGFTPTPEWVRNYPTRARLVCTVVWQAAAWRRRLPLGAVLRLLEFFLPRVEELCRAEYATAI